MQMDVDGCMHIFVLYFTGRFLSPDAAAADMLSPVGIFVSIHVYVHTFCMCTYVFCPGAA